MRETFETTEIRREALIEKIKLREQWEGQFKALNETDVLEILPEKMDKGIIGIDGKEYPFPSYEEIVSRLTSEKLDILEKKVGQGFTKLLITPLAMPLEILIDRYKRELVKHYQEGKLLATDGTKLELDLNNPIYVWDKFKQADISGQLIYYPERFSKENHGGKTKQELIDSNQSFEISLIEDLADLPAKGQGKTINGRKQFETGQSAEEYLKLLQEDPTYQYESGLTPEAWLTYALTHLHQTNQQIDDWQGKGKFCLLTDSYFPVSGFVPDAGFDRGNRQAYLCGGYPGDRDRALGFRARARI